MAGFDEINNIGGSSSSAGGSTTGIDENTFKKVDLEDAFKGKTWLESLALTIRDVFFDWSELNAEQIAEKAVTGLFGLIGLSLGGLAGAILGVGLSLVLNSVLFNHDGKLDSKEIFNSIVMLLAGAIGGFAGWALLSASPAGILIGITLGLAIGYMVTSGLEKTQESVANGEYHRPEYIVNTEKDLNSLVEYFGELRANLGIKTQEILDDIGSWLDKTGIAVRDNFNGIKDSATDIWEIFSTNFGIMLENDKLKVSEAWTNIKQSIVNNLSEAKTNASIKAVELFRAVATTWNNIRTTAANVWTNIKLSWDNLWTGMGTTFRFKANNLLSNIENWLNSFIGGINSLSAGLRSLGNDVLEFFGINYSFREIGRISLPRLATGTNYVPEDTLAMLHQGEAVVPKKFNSEEFFNGNSEETNDLLRELIQVVREKKTTISKKDVGEASIDYIRSQTRLKGASVI